jgi:hypothetical protein
LSISRPDALGHIRVKELLKLLQVYPVTDLMELLANPGPEIETATLQLVQQMARGGAGGEAAEEEEIVREPQAKAVVVAAHAALTNKNGVVKPYQVKNCKEIPGVKDAVGCVGCVRSLLR